MPRAKSPHGTYAAYRRHLADKTPVCDPCRAAQGEHDASRSTSSVARAEKAKPKAPIVPVGDIPTTAEGHISRLEVLREMLTTSRETIASLKSSDPSRLYLLMREQRDIVREISEIQGNGQVKGVTLADQLADARAKRAAAS
jgi:hypothetical protein